MGYLWSQDGKSRLCGSEELRIGLTAKGELAVS